MKIYIYIAKGIIVKHCKSERNQVRSDFLNFQSYNVNSIK